MPSTTKRDSLSFDNLKQLVLTSAGGLAVGGFLLWIAWQMADQTGSMEAGQIGTTLLQALAQPWPGPVLVVISAVVFALSRAWRTVAVLTPVAQQGNAGAPGHPSIETGRDSGDRTRQRVPRGLIVQASMMSLAAMLIVSYAGELIRVRLLTTHSGFRASALVAGIGLERVLDFTALLILIGIALTTRLNTSDLTTSHWSASPLLWTSGLLAGAIGVGALLALILLARAAGRSGTNQPGPRSTGTDRDTGWPAWLRRQAINAQAGLAALHRPTSIVRLIAISLLMWGSNIAAISACASTVGLGLSPAAAITILALSMLGLALPSAPGQLGTIQLAFVAGLQLSTTDPASASAFDASLIYVVLFNGTLLFLGMLIAMWLLIQRLRSKPTHSETSHEP